ncbi:MAG: O-antigen polymerase [Parcubacteria group bacterium GW2011_GWF2_44_8b]|nr:MAG: O-antigen polymerase [Parcubacteria group bacterium GW2011_GWC1_43_30]KKT80668.1 MAG: O-antigen polymerase [Parcubacteria group bacterium GW2011_GWF2_44_8b]
MFSQTLRRVVFVGLFAIPLIPFLVFSDFFFPFITTKAFTWRIIIEIVFAAWVLLVLLDASYRPKRSLILYSLFIFLGIIGLADLLGVAPLKSFWSNFERMEGFITLLHLGMFFIVISSVFKEVDWKRWWNVSLLASFLMVLYSVLQIIGLKTINQGGVRVDGTLGNAIYLAVYMLFHIFIAFLFMWREWKNVALRWVYGLLILAQAFILYHTATRGAILGLLGGLLAVAVLNVRNKESAFVRKGSIATLVGLITLVGGFVAIKDAEFIQNSPVLSRFSSLTTEELKTQGRYFVWPIALEGVKERPFLGWGQENFNYIFNEHYRPEMYRLEPWFDRAHNIFLDWAVAGGILGLLSYLLLYVALLYSIWRRSTNLTHTEKSILTGLIAAYFFHNFFVFDHLISYILFFSLLSYLHYRNGSELTSKGVITKVQVRNIALPAVSILLALSLYFVNIKPITANVFLIEALKSLQTPGETLKAIQYFKKAYNTTRLGRPEIVEHLAANTVTVLTSDISMEEKNAYFSFAKDAVLKQAEDLSEDARYQFITGSFLSTVGSLDDALIYLERASRLMPGKQMIYLEIANAFLNKGEKEKAIDVLKYVGEISPDHKEQMEEYTRQIQDM